MNYFKKRKLRKESEAYILQQIHDAERRGYEQGLTDMRRLKSKEVERTNKKLEVLTQRVEEIKFATVSYINKDFARTQGLREELRMIKRGFGRVCGKVEKKVENFRRVG